MSCRISHVAALLTVLWFITSTVPEPAQDTDLKSSNPNEPEASNPALIAEGSQKEEETAPTPFCSSCSRKNTQPSRRKSHKHGHKRPRPKKAKSGYKRPRPKKASSGNKQRRPGYKKHKLSGKLKISRPHGKKRLKSQPDPGKPVHSGFAIIGDATYKGKLVSCKPKNTVVCMVDGCKIGTCDDYKNDVIYTKCLFGAASFRCNTSLVCDCDYEIGYVQRSATDKTCIRESECLSKDGIAKSEIRCSYTGCNDNATCDNAWNTTSVKPPACTSEHKLQNCSNPGPHCPLMHYWKNNSCVQKDRCFTCNLPREVAVCTTPNCARRDCSNTWNLPPCKRVERFPNCTTPPQCACDNNDGYVRLNNDSTSRCIDKFECISCSANEFYHCPNSHCSERTLEDIENDKSTVPCEPVQDLECHTKPECLCLFPFIRANKKCVLPSSIFNECYGDDFVSPVCLTQGCSLRNCNDMRPKNMCCGTTACLYHCTRSTIACQCNKGDFIYNPDNSTSGSKLTCATKVECETMPNENEDYDHNDDSAQLST